MAPPVLPSSGTSIVWTNATAPSRDAIPRRLDHRIVGTLLVGGQSRPFESVVSRLRDSRDRPVVLGPPLAPGRWLVSDGCCANYTHHRNGLAPNGELMVPQRFAIDFFSLDDQNRTWIGDPSQLDSYLSYEEPTLAAADGTVVVAFDGVPDHSPPPQPPTIPPIEETVGNHVILKVSKHVYLLYAHMKPGSIQVEVGQRLRRGQQIGLVGTTGNSTTPHLHFQVLTTPTFFPADSTPYVFERFDVVGYLTERIWDDNIGLQPTGTLPVTPAPQPFRRERAMPLDRDVIVFPPRR